MSDCITWFLLRLATASILFSPACLPNWLPNCDWIRNRWVEQYFWIISWYLLIGIVLLFNARAFNEHSTIMPNVVYSVSLIGYFRISRSNGFCDSAIDIGTLIKCKPGTRIEPDNCLDSSNSFNLPWKTLNPFCFKRSATQDSNEKLLLCAISEIAHGLK